MRLPRCSFAFALACAAPAGRAEAQIPDVAPLCADRPAATGASIFEAEAPRPARTGTRADRPASDLACIDLFATAEAADAAGVVALTRPWSPFGVTVTPEGRHRHELTAWLARLPEPATLGPYTTYVAWATPITLDREVRLGPVANGRNDLGEIAINKYLVLVSAEAAPDVSERTGPLVLRGRSPSSRMEAHDLMALAPSAEQGLESAGTHEHAGMWTMPPAYEGVPMLPGVMQARPRVAPLTLADVARSTGLTSLADVPEARPPSVVTLPDGGTLDLTAGYVRREIEGRQLLMLGFNGQVPGPVIAVREASTVFVRFTNETPFATAVHWHGIRLDNRFDGVPGLTQDAVEPGETFRYEIRFPDPGLYWYHPHHREDVLQELGLAGNLLVEPRTDDYYGEVDREEIVMLDDLLLADTGPVPFGEASANYMLMGRFGNVLLANGEPDYRLEVRGGEVVRFHLTNASSTRTFNVSFRASEEDDGSRLPPLPIKVVATDVSKLEREVLVESVTLAPAERYVVEVRFPAAANGGTAVYSLVNQVQGIDHRQGVFLEERSEVGTVSVVTAGGDGDEPGRPFDVLRRNDDVVRDIDRFRDHFDRAPDRELLLTLEVDSLPMAIEQSMNLDWIYFNPVEWTGTMPMMNWATTGREISWVLRDLDTGADNDDIEWRYRVGDVVKIRITNDRGAFHAMQHPLHVHGQRFLVLAQNGVANENMAWKDTVLLPTGSTTDILLELSNPGRWMVHCHIAEHLESGMKFVVDVEGDRP